MAAPSDRAAESARNIAGRDASVEEFKSWIDRERDELAALVDLVREIREVEALKRDQPDLSPDVFPDSSGWAERPR